MAHVKVNEQDEIGPLHARSALALTGGGEGVAKAAERASEKNAETLRAELERLERQVKED